MILVPDEPAGLKVVAVTTTQVKVGWEPPERPNGTLKGYYVSNGEDMFQ